VEQALRTIHNPHGPIFWLDGVAEAGITSRICAIVGLSCSASPMIAQMVAYHYHETSQLSASFYCTKDDTDRNHVGLIFTTTLWLCSFDQAFGERVSEAILRDVDLDSASPSMRLEKLIVEHGESVVRDRGFPSSVIVIDASSLEVQRR